MHMVFLESMLCCVQVASALSDPYLSFAAALNGLAGPLHGLANQVWQLKSYLLIQLTLYSLSHLILR